MHMALMNRSPTPAPRTQSTTQHHRRRFIEREEEDHEGSPIIARRTKKARHDDDNIDDRDIEVAEILILLSKSNGGYCWSSSPSSSSSTDNPGAAISACSPPTAPTLIVEGETELPKRPKFRIVCRGSPPSSSADPTVSAAATSKPENTPVNSNTSSPEEPISGSPPSVSASAVGSKEHAESSSYSDDPATAAADEDQNIAAISLAAIEAMKIQEPSPAAPAPSPEKNRYTCDVCGKSYTSYQALGGHKTGHQNPRRQTPTAAEKSNYSNAAKRILGDGSKPSGRSHTCSICSKDFETGWALGGHMRKHYNGRISTKPCLVYSCDSPSTDTSCVISNGGPSNSGSNPRDFDLNMLPPVEDEEEDFGLSGDMGFL